MNPFILANGVLYLGATSYSIYNGDWRMAVVWITYAISCGALAGAK